MVPMQHYETQEKRHDWTRPNSVVARNIVPGVLPEYTSDDDDRCGGSVRHEDFRSVVWGTQVKRQDSKVDGSGMGPDGNHNEGVETVDWATEAFDVRDSRRQTSW